MNLWIARDKNKMLWTYSEKPNLNIENQEYDGPNYHRLDEELYPNLKFEDGPKELTI